MQINVDFAVVFGQGGQKDGMVTFRLPDNTMITSVVMDAASCRIVGEGLTKLAADVERTIVLPGEGGNGSQP